MRRFLFVWLFTCCCVGIISAQGDSTDVNFDPNDKIDLQIEDVITSTGTDEEADYTIVTDFLNDCLKKPLNLNDASREQLLQLPGMNDLLVNRLFQHIAQFGSLTSVFELQAIEGFSEKILQTIQPYVTTDARPKDIDPNRLHTAGPPIAEVREGLQYEFIQRTSRILEKQAGYQPDETGATAYLGSPLRNYTRFRARYGQYFSFALTGEKDAGEKFQFSQQKKVYGYDFLSGHVAISNYGNLKSLVIGDYNIQSGQGLIFSSGLGFGKGAEVISAIKMQQRGIRPYASVNENSYRRGVAATYAIKRMYLTGFVSRTGLDGSGKTTVQDSLGNDDNIFSGFQLGGNHRTESELSKKLSLQETAFGGRAEYKGKKLAIGTSHLFQLLSDSISPNPNKYNQFDFRGKQNYLNGIDFDWVFQNFNFFGEIARSKSGGISGAGGLMAALSPKVDLAIHLRSHAKNFHSFNPYVFGEQPRSAQNEKGIYVGLRVRPNSKWMISSFFDSYSFPYNKSGTSYSSYGYDFLGQVDYTLRRGTAFYVRFRSDNRLTDADSVIIGQNLDYLVPLQRNQFRFQYQSQLSKTLIIRTRAEAMFYRQESLKSNGFVLYQDLVYKAGMKWKVTGRFAVFSTDDYNSRIYTYENDVPGAFSIPPLSQTGTRYYLILNYRIVRGLDVWLRLAQTRYFAPNNGNKANNLYYTPYTIGSGNEEIQGDTRSEVRFQVRYTF